MNDKNQETKQERELMPLWEVFIRPRTGLSHSHVGSVHASDEVMAVQAAIGAGEKKLGGKGRLLVRKSGTEPLIRVMAESEDPAIVETVVNDIVAEIEKSITG